MIRFLLNVVYLVSKPVIDFVLGEDVGDACAGHEDSREDCYRDSLGVFRCSVCACKVGD